jgi:hypothetical protein
MENVWKTIVFQGPEVWDVKMGSRGINLLKAMAHPLEKYLLAWQPVDVIWS